RANGVVLLHGLQNTSRPAKHSPWCPAQSRTRHRITVHHFRLRAYLPPLLPMLPSSHQAKPIGHAPCSGSVLCIFSSPARRDYVFFSAYACYRHAAELKILCRMWSSTFSCEGA